MGGGDEFWGGENGKNERKKEKKGENGRKVKKRGEKGEKRGEKGVTRVERGCERQVVAQILGGEWREWGLPKV